MQIIQLLGEKLTNTILSIIDYLPSIIISVIFVIIGFVFGSILGAATKHLISDILKVDKFLKSSGVDESVAGHKFTVGGILGGLVKWSVILSFIMASTEVLNLQVVSEFISNALHFIPNVIAAAIIIVVSVVSADFLAKVVSETTNAAKIKGTLASSVTRFSILSLGIFMALEQVIPSSGVLYIVTVGIVSAVALALGLSFGLAGKDHAEKIIKDLFR